MNRPWFEIVPRDDETQAGERRFFDIRMNGDNESHVIVAGFTSRKDAGLVAGDIYSKLVVGFRASALTTPEQAVNDLVAALNRSRPS